MDGVLYSVGSHLYWALGILCLINAAVLAIVVARHNRRSTPATAEVIAVREDRDFDGGSTYAPVFQIIDGPHIGQEWTSQSASNPAMHEVGDQVATSFDENSGVIHSAKSRQNCRFIAIGVLLFASVCS